MRIVAGALRGRRLAGPKSFSIRPTSDRLRETIFDILEHAYPGTIEDVAVIDVFAGAGALGLEALSRGAARALFVDHGAEARALLRQNIDALGLGGVTRVFRRDATRLGLAPKGERFGLAFLDPPYNQGLAGGALMELSRGDWLLPGALAVVEEAASATVELPQGFREEDTRRYGDTQVVFARWPGKAEA
ncbi:16S rRNA (guanine(966)-N(2))-methyltransferase RsmD [Methylocystis bryophila]|uniref:16S rRNA (Guanine(966)-N(2))-methyltransferase RsmD n=1 Tax=Methylocystis bryophila TaxID=655015 RepID=A0A1W6MYF9_9HYPH|nr:16S rRNA (guanine(966)-N(2))-methyltransferase RsmD [Methylocystis bryophila]ARN82621.1 16S rRNA (guanine(966)-N(2))-methyltransferase RsmD [Methylocystis bryophila]BDV38834.1 DNA methyltransferase [Methylocystis bryophila]